MNHPIVRSIVGVVAGMVVGIVLIVLIERAAYVIHPTPPGFDEKDRAQLEAHVRSAPTSVMLLVLLGYFVGPLAGAFLAARVAGRAPLVHAGIVACLFFVSCVMNYFLVPGHPTWFIVANLALFVPMLWLASRPAKNVAPAN